MSSPPTGPVAGAVAATFCATLVDEWVRRGVGHAVVSPGSRSTPLALALIADDRITVEVHHDERAAGFMALGIGIATGRPAVVLTTSGTATVELHPAVVEAHEADVPLIAATADRPPWLRGVGAPQTIDQRNLYGSAVRAFLDPGVPDSTAASTWRTLAGAAVDAACGRRRGPVQLNLAFDEPLVGTPGPLPEPLGTASPLSPPGADAGRDATWAAVMPGSAGSTWGRGVIVAGGDIEDPVAVLGLARALGWPVLADPRSGCRIPDDVVVAHPDALLRHAGFAELVRPDVVVRLGTPWASKVLGGWLDGLDAHQVGVHASGRCFDPGGSLDELVAAPPGAWCAALASQGMPAPVDPAWRATWRAADDAAAGVFEGLDAASPDGRVSEPGVARAVLAALPDDATLVVSSSMPVRDLEWFGAPRRGVRVVANRGANGIDGVVSTAVGVAVAATTAGGGPTAVLVGDVAMLHDTNALLGLAARGIDLTLVVVDNDGGGIFSFLPQAAVLDTPSFERLFGTPHGVDLAALARAHGVEVAEVDSVAEVRGHVARRTAEGGVSMVLVRTDRAANRALHDALHAEVASRLDALLAGGPGA